MEVTMESTWILVADAARARQFRVERPRGPLIEEAGLVHPEERLPERELATDDPGRARGPGGQQHALGRRDVKRETEAARFAGEVADFLREAREADRFRRLYLAASPHFLGALRQEIDAETAARIVNTWDKDLVGKRADEIRKHLPERL
ncbi:MAG: host attachment protein [Halofilum sp. (in: g-proteobacteria)]